MARGYWLAYHEARPEDVRKVFGLASVLVKRVPRPWQLSKRGRPPKFDPREHAAVCITAVALDLTYREVEGLAPGLLGRSMDHSTVGWALQRLPEGYIHLLIRLLAKRLRGLVVFNLYVADSTGVSTPVFVRRRWVVRPMKRQVLKLHALIGYSEQHRVLAVFSARVTSESVHDATQFKLLLEEWVGKGEPLLADRAYDAASNFQFAQEKGFRPIIHPRSFELHGFARREMEMEFELGKDLYRMRSVAEGFFGGLANRYLSRTRCRLLSTAVSTLLMVVAHDLRALARVQAMNGQEIFILLWIYSTNPVLQGFVYRV